MAEKYPRHPVPLCPTMPAAVYGHSRTGLFNGWSWAIEIPDQGYRIRDPQGRLRAKGARTWQIARRWAEAHAYLPQESEKLTE